jgi:hypothetical protein
MLGARKLSSSKIIISIIIIMWLLQEVSPG